MYLFLIVNGDQPQFKNNGFISYYQMLLFVAEKVCNIEP